MTATLLPQPVDDVSPDEGRRFVFVSKSNRLARGCTPVLAILLVSYLLDI